MTTKGGGMLVAAPERWDEACFAVPALRALVASGLGAGVLCPDFQEPFWRTIEGLAVIGYPERASARRIAAGIGGDWKASLAWEEGLAADAFAKAGIVSRVGPNTPKLRKRLTHPLTRKVGPQEHRVRQYLLAIEELGIKTERAEFFGPTDLGIPPEAGTVLLCPDSDFGANHEWPIERWLELGRALDADGLRLTVAGLPGLRGLGKRLAPQLGEETPFFEATPFPETMPLIAVHSLAIAADGSLPHLAAFVGTTCVTLFGPNDPAWKRPLGRRHSVLRRHVECAPCLMPKCPMDLRCQRELEVERVLAAAREKAAEFAL